MSNVEKKKPRRWLVWLRDIAILLAIFTLVQWWQARDLPKGKAPALAGASLTTQPMSLARFQGQPVLVHFWATWCPICRLEEGSIDNIAEDYAVITVATTSGDVAEIQQYLDENDLQFPVMMDESGDLARVWGVQGVPASFIVDSQGNIDYSSVGYSSELGLRIRLALAP